MDHDVIVIGAGAAGEAAGSLGAELGGRVSVIERDLVGGLCGFWACMPSKSLLDSANRHRHGQPYPWERASDRRDWMISRERIAYPDDASHVSALEEAGARVVRGSARIVGPGSVEVASDGERPKTLQARALVISVGSVPLIPPMEGLEGAGYWTSNDATSARELPSSLLVMGGGPVGVELAQVFARYGVRVSLVDSNPRILSKDHPRSSEVLADALAEDGVEIRTSVRATAVRAGGPGRVVTLSDGGEIEAAQLLVAVGRRPADVRALGAEEAGVVLDDRGGAAPDERMKVADAVYVAGDVSGGLQFTHTADYEGRVAVRNALGHEACADRASVPRTTFTDPETASVGMTLEEARERGVDAFEVTQDFATTSRGYSIDPDLERPERFRGAPGHVTAVIDRERGTLAGAFAACPGAAELIHLPVLAVKQAVPVRVLADTMGAFPTAARVFTNLMADAAARLD